MGNFQQKCAINGDEFGNVNTENMHVLGSKGSLKPRSLDLLSLYRYEIVALHKEGQG